jgi:hypothetical protein
MSARVRIALEFRVDDPDLLRSHAERTIARHGLGHPYDPDDLADCLVELLLHSNPAIRPYADYGVELVRTDLSTEEER